GGVQPCALSDYPSPCRLRHLPLVQRRVASGVAQAFREFLGGIRPGGPAETGLSAVALKPHNPWYYRKRSKITRLSRKKYGKRITTQSTHFSHFANQGRYRARFRGRTKPRRGAAHRPHT